MIVCQGDRDLRVEAPSPRDLVVPLVADLGPRPPLVCCGRLWGPLGRSTVRVAVHADGCLLVARERAEGLR